MLRSLSAVCRLVLPSSQPRVEVVTTTPVARRARRSRSASCTSARPATRAGLSSTTRRASSSRSRCRTWRRRSSTASRKRTQAPRSTSSSRREQAHLRDELRLRRHGGPEGTAEPRRALRACNRLPAGRQHLDLLRSALGAVVSHRDDRGPDDEVERLGYVGSFPIPEVIRDVNAFTLGAQSVNPDVKVHVVLISTWFDPPKEKQAAKSLIDAGADVPLRHRGQSLRPPGGRGQWRPRGDLELRHEPLRPEAFLSAVVLNWGEHYVNASRPRSTVPGSPRTTGGRSTRAR